MADDAKPRRWRRFTALAFVSILGGAAYCYWDELELSFCAAFYGSFKDDIFECRWRPRNRQCLLPALKSRDPAKRNVAALTYYHICSEDGLKLTPIERSALRVAQSDPSPEAAHYASCALASKSGSP